MLCLLSMEKHQAMPNKNTQFLKQGNNNYCCDVLQKLLFDADTFLRFLSTSRNTSTQQCSEIQKK